jgi:hypothetical protein
MTSAASADVSRLADALRASGQQADATTYRVLVESANYILIEMQHRVPVKSRKLYNSLEIRADGSRVIIGPNLMIAPYAPYVDQGTRPHEIKPKRPGGVLVFKMNGQTVFAKKVHHPGTKAQPFVLPAFQAWVDSLGPMAAEANIKVVKQYA